MGFESFVAKSVTIDDMKHSNTTIPTNPEQSITGYIINAGLSDRLADEVHRIQASLAENFPEAIWPAPRESLHITLMDWLAPLVDYRQDKDKLFQSIESEYVSVLENILRSQKPINVIFDTIEVHPAAIIIKGRDDGSYQRIRKQFLDRVDLLPNTKPPGQIVHSTICKFLQPIDVGEIKSFVESMDLAVPEEISEFRLARESQIFMQRYEVLRRFILGHHNELPILPTSHT
jgi:hypothetical protein